MNSLYKINNQIIKCKKCTRLVQYREAVSKTKKKEFRNQTYWGSPVPGFGDPNAKLLILGLAPAAHGGNRTGRMFTGDSSGDWLTRALYQNGFANQLSSISKNDGLKLINTYVTSVLHCAPPQNKPAKIELENCSEFVQSELVNLRNVKVIVCLGKIAFDSFCRMNKIRGKKFKHGNTFVYGKRTVIASYHPSRQNTQTGRLKWGSWNNIFKLAKKHLQNHSK